MSKLRITIDLEVDTSQLPGDIDFNDRRDEVVEIVREAFKSSVVDIDIGRVYAVETTCNNLLRWTLTLTGQDTDPRTVVLYVDPDDREALEIFDPDTGKSKFLPAERNGNTMILPTEWGESAYNTLEEALYASYNSWRQVSTWDWVAPNQYHAASQ